MASLLAMWQTPPPRPATNVGHYITTNDGVNLNYDKFGHTGPAIVLIHGWGASRHFWDLSTRTLARGCQIYTYDQRCHGASDKPTWGWNLARLAADLDDLLKSLELSEVGLVGAGMGAQVIWKYLELFAGGRIAKAAFIDQTPLMSLKDDWRTGSNFCYDTASLTRLQMRLDSDFEALAREMSEQCAPNGLDPDVASSLRAETMRALPSALAELASDCMMTDARPGLPRIAVPCLNLVARKSSMAPWWATEQVAKLIPHCHNVFFETGNHWMYLENSEKFNQLILDFAKNTFVNVSKVLTL